jgi:hypothetical protein
MISVGILQNRYRHRHNDSSRVNLEGIPRARKLDALLQIVRAGVEVDNLLEHGAHHGYDAGRAGQRPRGIGLDKACAISKV